MTQKANNDALYCARVFFAALILTIGSFNTALGGISDGLRAKTPKQSIELRLNLIRSIWGTKKPSVPVVRPENARDINVIATFGRRPDGIKWLVSDLGHGMKARTIYATFSNSKCLFVINAGHSQGFTQPPPSDLKLPLSYWSVPGSVEFLKRIAARNCDLLLSSMPFYGENRYYALDVG